MKILHISHKCLPESIGGTELFCHGICQKLSESHEVNLYSGTEIALNNLGVQNDVSRDRFSIRRINQKELKHLFPDRDVASVIENDLRAHLKTWRPDVVHLHHLAGLSPLIPKIIDEEFNIPVVMSVHDVWLLKNIAKINENSLQSLSADEGDKGGFMDKANRDEIETFLRNISICLFPSHQLKKLFERICPSNSTFHFHPTGIEKQELVKVKRRHYQKTSKLVFGYLGRVRKSKGVSALCNAFSDLSVLGAELHIYGVVRDSFTPEFSTLKKIAGVHFIGGYSSAELPGVLENLDVIVVPSEDMETAPLVIKEALSANRPVIGSCIGGIPELITASTGFLFSPGDQNALKDILSDLVNNPTQLNSLTFSETNVPSLEESVESLRKIYASF